MRIQICYVVHEAKGEIRRNSVFNTIKSAFNFNNLQPVESREINDIIGKKNTHCQEKDVRVARLLSVFSTARSKAAVPLCNTRTVYSAKHRGYRDTVKYTKNKRQT